MNEQTATDNNYTVWLVVEVGDTGEMKWCALDHFHEAAGAMELADQMRSTFTDLTGIGTEWLDD